MSCLGSNLRVSSLITSLPAMPLLGPLEGGPSGPAGRDQTGQGLKGQYVHWIVMAHLIPAVVLSQSMSEAMAITRT